MSVLRGAHNKLKQTALASAQKSNVAIPNVTG
jgi:hypothetical protein